MKQEKNENRMSVFLKLIVRGIRHLFLHNGWLKLLAVIIAVILWAGLISQDENVTREKVFQNVPVTVIGSDTLRRNNYIVTSDIEELLSNINVTAAVPQLQYDTAESGAYNLRVDLSRIRSAGEQKLNILYSKNATYGEVISVSPSSITVDVDEYKTRQVLPVTADYKGDKPDGWWISNLTIEPDKISVSGPKQLVTSISRPRIYVDYESIEWKEGTYQNEEKLVFFDNAGEPLDSSLFEISSSFGSDFDSIFYSATILPVQSYLAAESIKITGYPEEGYEIKGAPRFTPETISVAAPSGVLDQLNELPVEPVNVNGLTDTKVFEVKIQKPSSDAVLSNDTILVTVEVGPVETEN